MEFLKYMHVERLGNVEVELINVGNCYVFPKVDGTNSSLWLQGDEIRAGSRNRALSLESDNAGFYAWALQQEDIKAYLRAHPTLRLYGEWLVPHTLKTYREDAWRRFYVFDVAKELSDGSAEFLKYETYMKMLEEYDIDYIQPMCIIQNPTEDQLLSKLDGNTYLIKDGQGVGEGIVIKNYDFYNHRGDQVWAKLVRTEFKERSQKAFGVPVQEGRKAVEGGIINKFCTPTLIEKTYAKIVNESGGWTSKLIPRLLQSVFYDLVSEECWNFVKEHKQPTIDFKLLSSLTTAKIKDVKEDLFR